jgi:2-keto-4-pentenoate hydratase/2-oxohepta-3-ene-1,7-dioic acid hydratase in catechol pathway
MRIEDQETVKPPSVRPAVSHRRFARLQLPTGRTRWAELSAGAASLLSDAPWLGGVPTGETLAGVDAQGGTSAARAVAPVAPSKILCVGRNYRAHARELGNDVPAEPLLFLKPPSSILDPGGAIELPPGEISSRVEHEAELAIVIGKRTRKVSPDDAWASIFGLTLLCDVTARVHWPSFFWRSRAKGMDTFCPIGPVVVTGLDPHALRIVLRVNGEVRQDGSTADMVFDAGALISYASQCFTLEPGDVFATGTPAGVGPLRGGDRLEIEVPEIGVLSATVRAG